MGTREDEGAKAGGPPMGWKNTHGWPCKETWPGMGGREIGFPPPAVTVDSMVVEQRQGQGRLTPNMRR